METFRIIYRDGFKIDIAADEFDISPLYVRFFVHLEGGWLGLAPRSKVATFRLDGIRGIAQMRRIRQGPHKAS